MAGRAMKVAVLEGDFVALCNLGLPFSVSYQLQEKGLKLPDALWTIKSSASGFSVSLFWPSSASENMKKKKRRRKRAKAKKLVNSKISDQANQDISCKESMEKPASEIFDIPTPTRAHHHLELTQNVMPTQDALPSQCSGSRLSKSTPSLAPTDFAPSISESENGVDLTACSNVNFELRDGQAGVRFEDSSNTSGWTPVVGRRKKRPQLPPCVLRRFPPNHPLRQSHTTRHSDSASSSEEEVDEDLVIPQTADVYFDVVEGTPGLQINTRNTSRWTPIACRTRSKSKY